MSSRKAPTTVTYDRLPVDQSNVEYAHGPDTDNLRVAAALAESGYDFRLVLGDGGHSPNHGGVLLPDALRWLWRTTDPR